MALDDMLDDGEAKPGSALGAAAAGVDAVKAFGEARDMFRGDAFALVAHPQVDGLALRRGGHGDPPAGEAIADGVADQIVENLEKLRPVARDERKIGGKLEVDLAATLSGRVSAIARGFLDEGPQLQRFGRRGEPLRLDPR